MSDLISLLWWYWIRKGGVKHLKRTFNYRNLAIFIADNLKFHIRLLGSFVHLKESIAEQPQEGKQYDHKGKDVTASNMLTTDIYSCWLTDISQMNDEIA